MGRGAEGGGGHECGGVGVVAGSPDSCCPCASGWCALVAAGRRWAWRQKAETIAISGTRCEGEGPRPRRASPLRRRCSRFCSSGLSLQTVPGGKGGAALNHGGGRSPQAEGRAEPVAADVAAASAVAHAVARVHRRHDLRHRAPQPARVLKPAGAQVVAPGVLSALAQPALACIHPKA